MRWRAVALSLSAAAVFGCSDATPPRVILFLADGVGNGQWTVARLVREDLAVTGFAAQGLVDTRGSDHVVTGSAPAATAYATGVRSRMRAIGLGPDLEPRTTVLEYAQQRGMATGLVTTTMLTDATPAAFATHYPKRDHLAVARQLATASVTVLLGGGRMMFNRARVDGEQTALDAMRPLYTYVETSDALDTLDPDSVTALLGLFAEEDLAPASRRRPTLAEMTATAIDILGRDPEGFFLLIETEETDTQAHDNAPFEDVAAEMLAFDDAIRVAVEYRKRHPDALVLVTSDHEAGGVSIHEDVHGALVLQYATTGHTAELVPIFADGPGAAQFGGLIDNDEIGRRLISIVRGE